MNFKINSRTLFTIIFKLKNDNFKTRDFSPLIERVLAGVMCFLMRHVRTRDFMVILGIDNFEKPPTSYLFLAKSISNIEYCCRTKYQR